MDIKFKHYETLRKELYNIRLDSLSNDSTRNNIRNRSLDLYDKISIEKKDILKYDLDNSNNIIAKLKELSDLEYTLSFIITDNYEYHPNKDIINIAIEKYKDHTKIIKFHTPDNLVLISSLDAAIKIKLESELNIFELYKSNKYKDIIPKDLCIIIPEIIDNLFFYELDKQIKYLQDNLLSLDDATNGKIFNRNNLYCISTIYNNIKTRLIYN